MKDKGKKKREQGRSSLCNANHQLLGIHMSVKSSAETRTNDDNAHVHPKSTLQVCHFRLHCSSIVIIELFFSKQVDTKGKVGKRLIAEGMCESINV